MNKRLYVGSLAWATNDETLSKHFEQAGQVASAKVIVDKFTNRSRGFGFVEMADDAASDKAIEMLHKSELDGRQIIVNEAQPMTDKPKGNFRGSNNRRF